MATPLAVILTASSMASSTIRVCLDGSQRLRQPPRPLAPLTTTSALSAAPSIQAAPPTTPPCRSAAPSPRPWPPVKPFGSTTAASSLVPPLSPAPAGAISIAVPSPITRTSAIRPELPMPPPTSPPPAAPTPQPSISPRQPLAPSHSQIPPYKLVIPPPLPSYSQKP